MTPLVVRLLATVLFAFGLAMATAQTPAGHAQRDVSELELLVRQPDGTSVEAHFLVSAANAAQAFDAAAAAVDRLYPGADIEPLRDDAGGVSAQWAPWGWQWDDDEIPVAVHYNPVGAIPGFTEADVVMALETWSSVQSTAFAFDYAGTTTAAPSLSSGGTDGLNVIGWTDLGCEVGCVLGLTTKAPDAHEVDIAFNTNPGARLGDGADGSFDATTVLIHEAGHMVGLEHSCPPLGPCTDAEKSATMFFSYRGVNRQLHEDDIAGISALYPGDKSVAEDPPPVSSSSSPVRVDLVPGWNFVSVPGTTIGEFGSTLSCVEAVYLYREGGWLVWIRDAVALSSLESAPDGAALWVLSSRQCSASFR